MKRLFLALSLLSLPCSTFAESKWLPSWLTWKKQSNYFHLPTFSKSIFERSNTEKAGICAGIGVTAALATAAIFFLQKTYSSTPRR